MPALLTSTCSAPRRATVSATSRSLASVVRRSEAANSACPPLSLAGRVQRLPWSVPVAHSIDGLHFVALPFRAPRLEVRVERAIGHARGHEHERIALEVDQLVAGAPSPAAWLDLVQPGAVAVQVEEPEPTRAQAVRP